MNALSINIPANFIFSCENTLARYAAATSEGVKRAILDRQTLQGIKCLPFLATGKHKSGTPAFTPCLLRFAASS